MASSLNNLAGVLAGLGNYSEAEELFVRAQNILEKNFGVSHPYVIAGLENLAEFYDGTGKPDEAKSLKERAAQLRTGN